MIPTFHSRNLFCSIAPDCFELSKLKFMYVPLKCVWLHCVWNSLNFKIQMWLQSNSCTLCQYYLNSKNATLKIVFKTFRNLLPTSNFLPMRSFWTMFKIVLNNLFGKKHLYANYYIFFSPNFFFRRLCWVGKTVPKSPVPWQTQLDLSHRLCPFLFEVR